MLRPYTVKVMRRGKEDEITAYRTTNDVNGNPRYIIHFLALGLKDHESTTKTRRAGFRKLPNCRAFGGGFTFQAHYLQGELQDKLDILDS